MADLVFNSRDSHTTMRVPLVQNPNYSNDDASFVTYDQAMINCFPVSSVGPTEKEVWISKRPGSERISTINLSAILGNIEWVCVANISITSLNDIYVCCIYDVTNNQYRIIQYRPITGTATLIGSIAGTASTGLLDQVYLTELVIANVATLGVVWNSNDGATSLGYYATSAAGVFTAASLTQIVDTDFPPERASPLPLVGGFVQMDGFTFAMTNTGEIVNSDVNSITSWNTDGTVQAISYPDQGVGLMRYKNHLVAFGEDSIEFFNNVANPAPDTPLGRVDQAFIKFGAVSARSILALDDTIYWLSKSASGTIGLWRLDGYTPVKLSGPGEDVLLSNAPSLAYGTTVRMSPITYYGQRHILFDGVTFRPLGAVESASVAALAGDPHTIVAISELYTNLAYSINERTFWGYSNSIMNRSVPIATSRYVLTNTYPETQYYLLGSISGAMSYTVDPGYIYVNNPEGNIFVDGYLSGVTNGSLYTFYYAPNRIMWSTEKRKRVHKLKAVFDRFFSGTPAESGAYLWFLIAKDEISYLDSSSNPVVARYEDIPNSFGRYYISNLGSFRTLGIALVSKNAMAMRLRALEIDMSMGTS